MDEDPQRGEPTDGDLLRGVARGNEQALESLCQRYGDRLFRYVEGLVRDRTIAEDVAYDTFADVWRGAERFRGASMVGTWIFGIARHKALSVLRARRMMVESDEVLAMMPSGDIDVLDQLSDKELAMRVRRALEVLAPEQREVIELSLYHGFSYSQIAEIVGCPLNTVKARAYYARRHLKGLLADE